MEELLNQLLPEMNNPTNYYVTPISPEEWRSVLREPNWIVFPADGYLCYIHRFKRQAVVASFDSAAENTNPFYRVSVDLLCAKCGAPTHPATYHAWSETCVLCGPCADSWRVWLKRREAQFSHCLRGETTSFAQAALTSIKPTH